MFLFDYMDIFINFLL